MKTSLTLKIFIIIFLTVFLTSLVGFAIVSFFSEQHYLSFRVNDIKENIISILSTEDSIENKHLLLNRMAISQNALVELYQNNNSIFISQAPYQNLRIQKAPLNFDPHFMKKMVQKPPVDIANMYIWEGNLYENYSAVIQLPARDISRILSSIKRLLLLILPSGFILAMIAAFVTSFYISRPIIKLNNAARQLGNLRFDVTINDKRKDEIGELAKTINWLSLQLGNTFSKLKGELEKEKMLDKLRRTFIAQVSHEIKTPIAVISSYTEALTDRIPDTEEQINQYYEIINLECVKLNQMLENILDLSQMEAGTFKIKTESFKLDELLLSVYKKHTGFIKLVNLNLNLPEEIKTHGHYPLIEGDFIKLSQVLDNFIDNAVKHTPENGVITLFAQNRNSKIEISVENTGSHI